MRLKRPDWFLTGMVIAIVLAWLFPGPGAEGGSMHPELVTKGGIALIFFLHGALLSFAALKDGISRFKLHLIVQLTTFVAFPLIGLGLMHLTQSFISPDLALGLFYLCALPSTVSSSVAMTAAARGNVPVAVFNATLSSLIGIVLTPFWMSLILHQTSQNLDLGAVMVDLVKWLLLPLIVGHLLRPLIGNWLTARKPYVSKIDRLTILLLVYTSFCDSFKDNIWLGHDATTMIVTVLTTALLFVIVLLGLIAVCRALGMEDSYRAAVVFCGTKKSLATGVPMAHLIFPGSSALGLILLPIMLYHPLQLFVCGPLANYWAKKSKTEA